MAADVSSELWTRRVSQVDDGVRINEVRGEPGAISAWHHHGDQTGYVNVLKGRVRIEWGPGGNETADLRAGDFYIVEPYTIQRESNPGPDDHVLTAWVIGSGPWVVNVDGPEPA